MKNLLFPALFGLGLVGCSQSPSVKEVAVPIETAPATSSASISLGAPAPPSARAVIYQGALDLAVDDFEQTTTGIDHLLQLHGAYLATAHETRADGQHRQEMTLKVPPAEFLPLVTALGNLGRIDNKDVTSSDITAELLAATATLKAQEATENKYKIQFAQASSPAEMTRLKEQAQWREPEIAAAKARLAQLGARSSWATLTVRYFQVLPTLSAPMPDFAPRFLEAFYRGWSFLLEVAVVLTNLWPLLLLGATGTWGLRRWRLRQSPQV